MNRAHRAIASFAAAFALFSFTNLPAELASGDIDGSVDGGAGDDWARKAGPEGRALLERR